MKNGDVVFFKKAKRGSGRKMPEVQFKGYGFGVMLGHVPPFAKDPPPEHLLRLMGTIGFISFDDLAEILGDEAAQKAVLAFEDKYYGKKIPLCECGKNDVTHELPKLDDTGKCVKCQNVRIQLPAVEETPLIVPPQSSKLVGVDGKPILSSIPEVEQ